MTNDELDQKIEDLRLNYRGVRKFREFLELLGIVPVPIRDLADDLVASEKVIENYLSKARKHGLEVVRKRGAVCFSQGTLKDVRELFDRLKVKGNVADHAAEVVVPENKGTVEKTLQMWFGKEKSGERK